MSETGSQPPPDGVAAGATVSARWVVAIARGAVGEIAPRELVVFDAVADSWLAGEKPRRRALPGASVGSGVEVELLSELIFPVLTAALGQLLGNAVWERVRPQRKGRHRRSAARRAADAGVQRADLQPDTLRAVCVQEGVLHGLPQDTAAALADAIRRAAATAAPPLTSEP